jgi:histidine triad (HIT) family protein
MAGRDWYCEDVLSGKTDVKIVWEDDFVVAFHHSRPHADNHVVVIPKKPVSSILDPAAWMGSC